MNYRVINTAIHQDEWVRSLTLKQRNIWFYLLTAPESNLSGIYQIDLRYMELNTGINLEEIGEIFKKFSKDNRMEYRYGYVILINFLSHQQLNTNQIKRVYKIITEQIPAEVREYIRQLNHFNMTINDLDKYETLQEWFINGLKPLPKDTDKEKGKEKLKEKLKEKRQAKGSAGENTPTAAADASLSFEELVGRYDFLRIIETEGLTPRRIQNLIKKYGINKIFMVYQHIYNRPANNWIGLFLKVIKSDEPIPITSETKKMAKLYKLEV